MRTGRQRCFLCRSVLTRLLGMGFQRTPRRVALAALLALAEGLVAVKTVSANACGIEDCDGRLCWTCSTRKVVRCNNSPILSVSLELHPSQVAGGISAVPLELFLGAISSVVVVVGWMSTSLLREQNRIVKRRKIVYFDCGASARYSAGAKRNGATAPRFRRALEIDLHFLSNIASRLTTATSDRIK